MKDEFLLAVAAIVALLLARNVLLLRRGNILMQLNAPTPEPEIEKENDMVDTAETERQERVMKIGERVWIKQKYGLWAEQEVVGETSRSWIIIHPDTPSWQRFNPDKYGTKLAKSGRDWEIGTEADVKLSRWADTNRWRISSFVEGIKEANFLLQVARLIGYKELPPEENT